MTGERILHYKIRKDFSSFCSLAKFAFFFISFLQKNNKNFLIPLLENIFIENGLPANSLSGFFQYYLVCLWLRTHNALVRYVRYSMKVFRIEEIVAAI